MMRNRPLSVLIVVVAMALVSLAAYGAGNAMRAKPTAVAVVNVEQVFNNLKEKTQLEADLRSEADKLKQEQAAKKKHIGQLQQDLQVLAPGTDGYRQKQQTLEKAALEFQVWSQFHQRELTGERSLQIQNLYHKTVAAIATVAQADGYELVLYQEPDLKGAISDPNQLTTQIRLRKVLYAADALDITDQVIQRMNNEYQAKK